MFAFCKNLSVYFTRLPLFCQPTPFCSTIFFFSGAAAFLGAAAATGAAGAATSSFFAATTFFATGLEAGALIIPGAEEVEDDIFRTMLNTCDTGQSILGRGGRKIIQPGFQTPFIY